MTSGDIHPTAVMWGVGNDKVTGAAAEVEENVVQHSELLTQLAMGLEQREVSSQRRSLRLPIDDMHWQWTDQQTLVLSFTLMTGSFATSVLASVVQRLT